MKTTLQRITDLLEAGGVRVSAVKTWPPDDEGEVSVSLRVRPLPVNRAVRRRPEEEDGEPEGGACSECVEENCGCCPNSPENGTPVKLYTPQEAAAAMLAGKCLKNEKGCPFYWQDRGSAGAGFWMDDNNGDTYPALDFNGLYSERENG